MAATGGNQWKTTYFEPRIAWSSRGLREEAVISSRRVTLGTVLSSSLGVGMIFGFQPPLMALVLGHAGSSNFMIGAVTASSLIAVIFLGPIYPAVIARFGLKTCVVAGVAGAAALLLCMPLRPTIGFWFLVRFLSGAAFGLCWIASEVWLNCISGETARGTVMGLYGTVFSVGVMLGPVLLGVTGTQGAAPFVVGALCLLASLLPLALLPHAAVGPQRVSPMRHLMGAIGAAPVVMLAALIAGLIESADLALLPLFGIHGGFTDARALLLVTVFMAGNVVLQVPIGLLADRLGRRLLLGACALLSGFGPLLLPRWLDTPALLWPLVFLWGGTLFAFYSQGMALLGEAFDPGALVTANTVFVMVYCLGGVIGPSVGGVIMDAWPGSGLPGFLSAAAFSLCVALVAEWRRATARRAASDPSL